MAKLTKTALSRKKPVTDEVLIPADDAQAKKLQDAKDKVEVLHQRVSIATIGGVTEDIAAAEKALAEAEAGIEEVRDEIRKTGVSITLAGIGRDRWDAILREHPPTEEMKAADAELPETDRRLYDPVTFWPALLAETADSDLTADDWQKNVFSSKDWGPAELKELRDRASAVNQGSRILELGN